MMKHVFLGLLVAAGVAGCGANDPNFCENAPLHTCSLLDAPVDTGCTSNAQCSGSAAVCDVTGTKTCVQCAGSDDTACVGTTPTCGTDDTCQACTTHADCASAACLPDGSCGTDANVAYVDPAGTDNTMCTKAMPCTSVPKALATSRAFVKFHGTTDAAPMGVTVSSAQHVTFLADPGALLTRSSGGAILTVKDDNTSLAVLDLAISNAPNTASGFGLVVPTASGAPTVSLTRVTFSNNPGGAISSSGGSLTISQSTLSGNAGGGISVTNAQFDIENNFIATNGGPGTAFGGVSIAQITSGTGKLLFNTITNNDGSPGTTTGVVCSLVTQPIVFSNNIVFGNQVSSGGTQVGGTNCSTTFSDIGPDGAAGTGNINMDPMFVNATQNNFHIMSGSPAKEAADPAATLTVDFDGDMRPQGPHSDMGADEFKP